MDNSDKKLKLINRILNMDDSMLSEFEVLMEKFNSDLELPRWQKDILDQRLEDHSNDPQNGDDWETAKKRLQTKANP